MRLRRNAKVDLLATVPLFSECSKKELGVIATITDEVTLAEGATLIREGTLAREFFLLVEGTVKVKKGGSKTIGTVGPGEFFGEIALVTATRRSASVIAASTVRLLVITDRAFKQLMEDSPSIQTKVLKAMATRLASLVPEN